MGISEAIYYRWKKEYNGMVPNQARRLKALEKEIDQLKKLLAETIQDKRILKNINQGHVSARRSLIGCFRMISEILLSTARCEWLRTHLGNGLHV